MLKLLLSDEYASQELHDIQYKSESFPRFIQYAGEYYYLHHDVEYVGYYRRIKFTEIKGD